MSADVSDATLDKNVDFLREDITSSQSSLRILVVVVAIVNNNADVTIQPSICRADSLPVLELLGIFRPIELAD